MSYFVLEKVSIFTKTNICKNVILYSLLWLLVAFEIIHFQHESLQKLHNLESKQTKLVFWDALLLHPFSTQTAFSSFPEPLLFHGADVSYFLRKDRSASNLHKTSICLLTYVPFLVLPGIRVPFLLYMRLSLSVLPLRLASIYFLYLVYCQGDLLPIIVKHMYLS